MEESNKNLKVAAVQFDIDWLSKPCNLQKLDVLIGEHVNPRSIDLLVLPETFSTGFSIREFGCEEIKSNPVVLNWIQSKARALDCVVCGSVLVEHTSSKSKPKSESAYPKKLNRFYWCFPDGKVQHYDKRHLFRLGNEQDYVVAGQERLVIELKGFRILPTVCYDLRFPVWSRNKNDYDLLINVANWPAVRRNVWDTLLKARAMENQTYVIGVNRVGDDGYGTPHSGGTTILDFVGETLVEAEDNTEQVIKYELELDKLNAFKEKFPAYLDADDFSINTE